MLRLIALLVVLPVVALADEWQTLSNCTVVANSANDADSFHVRNAEGYEFTFRLYFVDAPETSNDAQLAKRVEEQAAHFGIDEKEVVKWGRTAAASVAARLKGEKLIVTTKWQIAPGRGSVARNYAFVEIGPARDLAVELVSEGLARVHGVGADAPNGFPKDAQWERLNRLEAEARAKKRGAWQK